MYSTHGGIVNLEDEEEIVWNEPKTKFQFVREWVIQTTKWKGLPQNIQNNSYSIIGYANLSYDAEKIHTNIFSKRIFVLKDTDLDKADNFPHEAVNPKSIKAGAEPENFK